MTIERNPALTNLFRLFGIAPNSGLTLKGLVLRNGFAQGGHSWDGGGALGSGGAIFNQGNLLLDRCTLSGNVAVGGGSGNSSSGTGGGGVGASSTGARGGGPNGAMRTYGPIGSPGGFGGGGAVGDIGSYGGSGGFGGGGSGASGIGPWRSPAMAAMAASAPAPVAIFLHRLMKTVAMAASAAATLPVDSNHPCGVDRVPALAAPCSMTPAASPSSTARSLATARVAVSMAIRKATSGPALAVRSSTTTGR